MFKSEQKFDFSLLLLRLGAGGFMLVTHGWIKLNKYTVMSQNFPDPFGWGSSVSLALVVFAEVVCAALLVLGLFTRMAAIPLIVTMLVAFFVVHGADPWAKKELSAMYLLCYLVIFVSGPGRYSLQSFFKISSNSRFAPVSWLMK